MKKVLSLLLCVMCAVSLLTVVVFADDLKLGTTTTETSYGLEYEITEDFAKLKTKSTVLTTKDIVRIEDPNGDDVTFEKVSKGVMFTADIEGTYKLYGEEPVVTPPTTPTTPSYIPPKTGVE